MIERIAIALIAIGITFIAARSALVWANAMPAFLLSHPHATSAIAPLSIVFVVTGVMLRRNRERT